MRSVRVALAAAMFAGVLAVPATAAGGTRTFTGSVDAAGVSWKTHQVDVDAPSTIVATLDWTTASANLNLFLYAPTGELLRSAASTTNRPEAIRFDATVSGAYRLGVKAKSGASSYTLTVDGVRVGGASYLTILFGRTQWVATESCVRLANTVDLGQVAAEMKSRGLVGTGNVILKRTNESGYYCQLGYALHPDWPTLANLRDTYGWTFVSAGRVYANMTKLSSQESQHYESCGSLQAFSDRGHHRAWGLFAYPGNASTDTIQKDVVSKCFAFGRRYSMKLNDKSTTVTPWFQNTHSVNAGACNDPALQCYDTAWVGISRRYTTPDKLAVFMAPGPNQWSSIQFYRFVTGAKLSGGQRWDCSSPDPRAHWSNKAETYCWVDFLAALDMIPAGTIVTDPATVAQAWGRAPG
jgi:hypothetical protein